MSADPAARVLRKPDTLPRDAWLTRHADYQRVYREGRRQSLPLMTYFFALRAPGSTSRVGLTAGRVLGNAVERNRIKRRMRAAVREHRAELTAGVDLILHPRRTVLAAEFAAIEQQVRRALQAVQALAETAERTECALPGQPARERGAAKLTFPRQRQKRRPPS